MRGDLDLPARYELTVQGSLEPKEERWRSERLRGASPILHWGLLQVQGYRRLRPIGQRPTLSRLLLLVRQKLVQVRPNAVAIDGSQLAQRPKDQAFIQGEELEAHAAGHVQACRAKILERPIQWPIGDQRSAKACSSSREAHSCKPASTPRR